MPDPLDVACPACFSKPGERCTQPDDHGRHEVSLTHYLRDDLAEATEPCKEWAGVIFNGTAQTVHCVSRGPHGEHSGTVWSPDSWPLAVVTWPGGISANREQRRHP